MMITVKANKKGDGNIKKLNVLPVCGSGASPGSMTTSMRKAAVARGLDVDIKVRSRSEIENYIEDVDVLVMELHLAYILDEVEEYTGGLDVEVILMNPDYCSILNGDKAIDHLLSEME